MRARVSNGVTTTTFNIINNNNNDNNNDNNNNNNNNNNNRRRKIRHLEQAVLRVPDHRGGVPPGRRVRQHEPVKQTNNKYIFKAGREDERRRTQKNEEELPPRPTTNGTHTWPDEGQPTTRFFLAQSTAHGRDTHEEKAPGRRKPARYADSLVRLAGSLAF